MTALLLALALSVREPPRSAWWRMGLMALTVGAGVMVFTQYGRIVGRDPGVALLFIFGPLKLIEARSSRDFMVVWGLGLMLFAVSYTHLDVYKRQNSLCRFAHRSALARASDCPYEHATDSWFLRQQRCLQIHKPADRSSSTQTRVACIRLAVLLSRRAHRTA